ncbi:hypothetical protein GQ42DRAFT_160473 [Ramicandelaber brevisporus]|nr:hypothetical protein GQ42DRAFT_160473 [Ramicandelaber brevisporus]
MSSLRSLGSGRSNNNNNNSSSSSGNSGGSGGSDGAPNIYFIKTSTFNTFENSSSACVIIEDAGPAAAMDHDALASFFKNIASSKSICSISTTSKYAIYVEVVSLSVANTLCAYIERRGVLGSYLDVKVEKGRAVDLLQQQVRTKSSYSSSSSLSRSTAASGPVVHMSYPATPASSRESVNERNVSEHRKRSQPSSRSVSPSSRSKRVSMGLDSSTPPSSTHSPSGQRHSYHDEQQRRGASSAQHSSLSLHLHASISTSSDRIRQFLSQFSDASSSKSLDCLIYAISANPDVIRLGKTLLSEYGDAGLTTALITGVEERAFQDRLYKQAAKANVKFISVINFYSCEESTTTIWRNVSLIKDVEFYNNGSSNRREKLVECFKAQLNWMSTVNARIRMQNALWRLSNRVQSVRTRTSLPEAVEPSLTGTASRSSQLTFTVTNSPSTVVSTLHDASAVTSLSQSSHQVVERESQTTHGISTDSVSSRSTTSQAVQAIKDKSPALHSVKSHTVAAATATATSISASNVQASSDSQKPKSSFTSISTATQTPTPTPASTPAPTSTSASKLTIDADNAQTTKFETKSHTATAAAAPAKQPVITNVAPVSTVVPRMVDASVMTDIRSTDMDIEEATAVFRRCFPDHQPSLNLYLRMAQSTPGKAGPKTAQSPVTNTTANGIKPKAHSQPPLNTTAADPRTQHQPKSPVQAKANKNPQTQQAAQTNVNPHTQVPQANKAVHHPATWQQQQQQREISKTLTDASTPKVDTQTSPLSITTPTNTQNGHTATQQYQGITQPQQQQQQQQQAHTQQNGSHSHPQLQVQNQNSIQAQPQPHPIAQVYSQPVTQPQSQSQSQLQTQQIAQLQQTAQQMPMNTMFMPQQFQSQQQQYQQQNMMMQWMQFQAYMQSQQMSQQMLQQQAQQMQQAQFQQPQTQSQTQQQPQQMHTQFTQAPLMSQTSGMTMPQE